MCVCVYICACIYIHIHHAYVYTHTCNIQTYLVDARFMRKSVGTDDGLVRLYEHARERGDELAAPVNISNT